MEFVKDVKEVVDSSELGGHEGEEVRVQGVVFKLRVLSRVVFAQLLDAEGLIQCVMTPEYFRHGGSPILKEGDWVKATGMVVREQQSKAGYEIQVRQIDQLSAATRQEHELSLHDCISDSFKSDSLHRPVSLRSQKRRAIFKIKGSLQAGFGGYLDSRGFTGINSPKIIFNGLEGGSKLFGLDYFGRQGHLSQSPQLYKQMMVGVLQKVYEIGPVFRANENRSSKQLNEFVALDVEFGPIGGIAETMAVCISAIRHAMEHVTANCGRELDCLEAVLPAIIQTPAITRAEAVEILQKNGRGGGARISQDDDIWLGNHFAEHCRTDFVFITNPPLDECTFYFMEDARLPGTGKSWRLLCKGLDVASGGQRIHSYEDQVARMLSLGMDPSDFAQYLMAHRYGLPPHGGFAVSLERLIMKLLDLPNIKEACIFPRDVDAQV